MASGTALPRALVALACAVVLTGCSGDGEEPIELPPLAVPSATPSASAPAIPAAAQPRTREAADVFVRFFFDEMNAAFSASDSARLRHLTSRECEVCERYASALDAARAEQRYVEGVSFRLDAVAVQPLRPLGTIAEVGGDIPARNAVNDNGVVMERLPADGRFRFQVALERVADRWIVTGLRRAGSG